MNSYRLTLDDAARAAARAFTVDHAIDSLVIRVNPDPRFPGGEFAAFHHDDAPAQAATLLGVYASDEAANAYLSARGHTGQHELELCADCRVAVMGPEFWDLD